MSRPQPRKLVTHCSTSESVPRIPPPPRPHVQPGSGYLGGPGKSLPCLTPSCRPPEGGGSSLDVTTETSVAGSFQTSWSSSPISHPPLLPGDSPAPPPPGLPVSHPRPPPELPVPHPPLELPVSHPLRNKAIQEDIVMMREKMRHYLQLKIQQKLVTLCNSV